MPDIHVHIHGTKTTKDGLISGAVKVAKGLNELQKRSYAETGTSSRDEGTKHDPKTGQFTSGPASSEKPASYKEALKRARPFIPPSVKKARRKVSSAAPRPQHTAASRGSPKTWYNDGVTKDFLPG